MAWAVFAAALLVGTTPSLSSSSSLSGQLLPSASGQQAAAQLPPGLAVAAVSLPDCAAIDPPAIVAAGGEAGAVMLVAPDRGDHAFDHWEDGSTNRTRTVAAAGAGASATLTAYYLPVAGRSPSTLTVSSMSIDGDTAASAVGAPVSVYRAGELALGPAASPVNFRGVSGLTYSVVAHDLPGYVFARWENGSTDPSREVTLGEAATAGGDSNSALTAYYRPSALGEPARVLVKAVGSSGEPRYMWTVISSSNSNGDAAAPRAGFAPMAFIGGVGRTYTVTVSDYQDRTFERWHDGDTNRTKTFTVAGDTALTAHFRTAPYVPLSLNATTLAGEPLPGIYVAVGKAPAAASNSTSSDGLSESGPMVINATTAPDIIAQAAQNIVATGFSPMTFNGDVGGTYVVTPQDFGPYTFHHWEDGSTERSRIVPAYTTRTITAHYDATGAVRAPVMLQTVDQTGAPLPNVYGIVTSEEEGGAVKVGNTPMTFMAVAGRPYLVTPTSHEIFATGRYDFDHWEDGSTNIFRTVAVPPDGNGSSVSAQTVTAYYRWRAASPTTVSVSAADISTGNPVAVHMDISPSGGTVVPGYLPRTFSLYSDTTYTLTPHDYGNYVFDHWEDGSTERVRTFVPPPPVAAGEGGSPASSSLVAYYKTIKPSPPPLPPVPSAAPAAAGAGSAAVALEILSPRAGQVMSSISPTVGGTAAATAAAGGNGSNSSVGIDRVEVSIDCGPYVRADGLERWSFGVPPSLSDGSHSATVRAVDSEGNARTASVVFAVNADPFLNRTGVYVPLFVYPAGKGLEEYDRLVEARQRHPSVPVITTINPASGPGEFLDDNFVNATKKLQDGGVTVAGYVYAGYGPRDAGKIITDIDKYATWYGVDGVFIDEFANWTGYEDKFRQIADYARSRGMEVVVANAGWEVAESYLGTVDTIGISEADGYVPPEMLRDCVYCASSGGWHYKHDKTNFWFVRYAIDPLDEGYVREVSKWVGLVYLTDGKSPVRWDHLPPYFDQLLATLE